MEETKLGQTKELLENLEKMYNNYSLISYYELIEIKQTQDVIDNLNRFTDFSKTINYQSI